MTTAYSTNLELALPVQGELSGTWGDTVNNGITQYLDAAIAGSQIISGSQTAVTLTNTNGDSAATNIAQAGSGATGTAQYQIIRCTGNPAGLLTVTISDTGVAGYSKTFVIINATSTSQSVKIVGSGPTAGITVASGAKSLVAWNGSDFVEIASSTADGVTTFSAGTTGFTPSSATSGAVTLSGTLATANGGTNLTSFTSGGVVYASSSSALATGSAFTYDGAGVLTVGSDAVATVFNAPGDVLQFKVDSNGGSAGAPNIQWLKASTELMRLDSSGNLGLGVSPSANWSGFGQAFQIGSAGSIAFRGNISMNQNYASNGSSEYFLENGRASRYLQSSGQHSWSTSTTSNSSGAGAAASMSTLMTLDTSGNLGVGTTSPTTLVDLVRSSTSGSDATMPNIFVRNTSATQGNGSSTFNQVVIGASAGNGTVVGGIRAAYDSAGPYGTGMQLYVNSTNPLQFFTNATERAKFDSAGTFVIKNDYQEQTYTANSSTAITLNITTNGTDQVITLTGTATITMPTATAGKSFLLKLKTGAGGYTVTWTTVKWPGGTAPTLTSTASRMDIFSFFSDGTNWYGTTVGQNYTP